MRILDLFCGAGGAAMGYHRAFPDAEIIGVDIAPQPRYPFTFVRDDVSELLWWQPMEWLRQFDLIHASPPCQAWSDLAKRNGNADKWPKLIDPVRAALLVIGVPWVIENVEGAPLVDPVMLCGTMFPGLRVLRHRLFEASFLIEQPAHPAHPLVFTHDKRKAHYGKLDQDTAFVQVTGGGNATVRNKADAMGIDWMTGHELNEAIPPAYTEFIGRQFAARTSPAGARQEQPDTHRTGVRPGAGDDGQRHTCRTAASLDGPSADDEVEHVAHQPLVAVGDGRADAIGVGRREVAVGDVDGELAVNRVVAESGQRVGVVADLEGRERHAHDSTTNSVVRQPQKVEA